MKNQTHLIIERLEQTNKEKTIYPLFFVCSHYSIAYVLLLLFFPMSQLAQPLRSHKPRSIYCINMSDDTYVSCPVLLFLTCISRISRVMEASWSKSFSVSPKKILSPHISARMIEPSLRESKLHRQKESRLGKILTMHRSKFSHLSADVP